MVAGGTSVKVRHLFVRHCVDHVGVRLEPGDSEQTIMVRWLFFLRNAKPFVVGIELTGFARHVSHWLFSIRMLMTEILDGQRLFSAIRKKF
jgi:hypothetical protein